MGIYLGITFNSEKYLETKERLENHAKFFHKDLKMKLFVSLEEFKDYINKIDCSNIDRIVLYDCVELGNLEQFKEFSNLCSQYRLEYSLINENVDLHSDVDIPLPYLFSVF